MIPLNLGNVAAIANPNGSIQISPLVVSGDVNLTGAPAPQYRINGVPIGGGVASISPGALSGNVTLAGGANVSITQSGQTIMIASTGGGAGASQWIDIAGGGIYYGGKVGIGRNTAQVGLDIQSDYVDPWGNMRVKASGDWNYLTLDTGAAPGGGGVRFSANDVWQGEIDYFSGGIGLYVRDLGSATAALAINSAGVVSIDAAPFDPGNPRLQVLNGLTVNNHAPVNGFACIRMISGDQNFGALWNFNNPSYILRLGATNAYDAYGNAAFWAISIDCTNGAVTVPTFNATNINASGNINAGSITVNGVPISAGLPGDWESYDIVPADASTLNPLAINWGKGFYRIVAGNPLNQGTVLQWFITFSAAFTIGSYGFSVNLPLPVQAFQPGVIPLAQVHSVAGVSMNWLDGIQASVPGGPIVRVQYATNSGDVWTIMGFSPLQ